MFTNRELGKNIQLRAIESDDAFHPTEYWPDGVFGVPVKTGIPVAYDLENKPLYIKTDSLVGSNEVLEVNFEDGAGNVVITFRSPPTYSLFYCLINAKAPNFPHPSPLLISRCGRLPYQDQQKSGE